MSGNLYSELLDQSGFFQAALHIVMDKWLIKLHVNLLNYVLLNVRITTGLYSILHQGFIRRVAVLGGLDVHLPEGAVVANPLRKHVWHTGHHLVVVVMVHPGLGVEVHIRHDSLKGLF